jgi:hypothetical protein
MQQSYEATFKPKGPCSLPSMINANSNYSATAATVSVAALPLKKKKG